MGEPERRGALRRLLVTGVVLTGVGCASLASVIFDAPQRPPPSAAPALQLSSGQLPEDTVHSPIETIRDADSVLALLPKDSGGGVDWVAALRSRVIAPRTHRPGTSAPPDLQGFRFDIVLKGPDEMFNADFAHSVHVEWLDCRSCHPTLFPHPPEPITMADVDAGKACGACHGPVAFPTTSCFRCHPAMPAEGKETPTLGRDVILLARAADSTSPGVDEFPPAGFSHSVHRMRFRCMACHPDPFQARAGADTLSMEAIERGASCGACHNGTTAFPVYDCQRCHVPQTAEAKKSP